MTIAYLITVLILNMIDAISDVISGINELFSISLSGEEMFWAGFLIVFLLDLLFGD